MKRVLGLLFFASFTFASNHSHISIPLGIGITMLAAYFFKDAKLYNDNVVGARRAFYAFKTGKNLTNNGVLFRIAEVLDQKVNSPDELENELNQNAEYRARLAALHWFHFNTYGYMLCSCSRINFEILKSRDITEDLFRELFEKEEDHYLEDSELRGVFETSLIEFSELKYIQGKSQIVPVACGLVGFSLLGYELYRYLKR